MRRLTLAAAAAVVAGLSGLAGWAASNDFDKQTGSGSLGPGDVTAQAHARSACVAYHRPNQIGYDALQAGRGRGVTEEEIRSALFDARTEASLAASLDGRWKELEQAIARLAAAQSDFDVFDAEFPVLRAQCLLAGSGDINSANLIIPTTKKPRP